MSTARQNSFLGGMLSPLLEGRDDFKRTKDGARIIRNFLVTSYGSLVKRPGTRYIADAQEGGRTDQYGVTRLYTFAISRSEEYVLEFTHLKCRVYVDGRAEEIFDTPYSGEDLISDPLNDSRPGLKFAQNQNRLLITHPEYKPRILTRLQGGGFVIELMEVGPGEIVSGLTATVRRDEGVRPDEAFVEFAEVRDVVTYVVSREIRGEGETRPSSQASVLILNPFHFARVFGPDSEGWYTADRPISLETWSRVRFSREGEIHRIKEVRFTDDGRLTFRLINDSGESAPRFAFADVQSAAQAAEMPDTTGDTPGSDAFFLRIARTVADETARGVAKAVLDDELEPVMIPPSDKPVLVKITVSDDGTVVMLEFSEEVDADIDFALYQGFDSVRFDSTGRRGAISAVLTGKVVTVNFSAYNPVRDRDIFRYGGGTGAANLKDSDDNFVDAFAEEVNLGETKNLVTDTSGTAGEEETEGVSPQASGLSSTVLVSGATIEFGVRFTQDLAEIPSGLEGAFVVSIVGNVFVVDSISPDGARGIIIRATFPGSGPTDNRLAILVQYTRPASRGLKGKNNAFVESFSIRRTLSAR